MSKQIKKQKELSVKEATELVTGWVELYEENIFERQEWKQDYLIAENSDEKAIDRVINLKALELELNNCEMAIFEKQIAKLNRQGKLKALIDEHTYIETYDNNYVGKDALIWIDCEEELSLRDELEYILGPNTYFDYDKNGEALIEELNKSISVSVGGYLCLGSESEGQALYLSDSFIEAVLILAQPQRKYLKALSGGLHPAFKPRKSSAKLTVIK